MKVIEQFWIEDTECFDRIKSRGREYEMIVRELIDFLLKQNQEARVTLTKSDYREYTDSDGYSEAFYDDTVSDLEPDCLTVDVLGNGDVDIRYL